jgi:hypothetical protein
MNTMTTKNLRELLKDSEEVRLVFHAFLEGGGSFDFGVYRASYDRESNYILRVRRAGRPPRPKWSWPSGVADLWRMNGEPLGTWFCSFERHKRTIHIIRKA